MAAETIEQRFAVSGPARLSVSNVRGSILVEPGESDAIEVRAVKHPGSGDPEHTRVVMTQADAGAVKVSVEHDNAFSLWLLGRRQPCSVDISVRAPQGCSVQARSVSAAVTVHDLQGDFDLGTVSGRLNLVDLTGSLRAESVSGKIAGRRLNGPARLGNIAGATTVLDSDLPAMEASTVSGDVTLETPPGAGPHRFETVSGAVKLLLPQASGCVVEGQSVSGRFRTSLPGPQSEYTGGGRWRVELSGGGPEISFRSVSGDLWLLAGEAEGDPVATAPPGGDAPARDGGRRPGDRSEILEQIASGKLSVDEGLAELQGR
ncbi:MAG: DUF4097 family beta strand repeat protein [Chloroflexi bacterium]|nr:DUF4097 family beta strand repeat protein [Chloroflexota bacterium]